MIEIAKLPADDRRELFHNTAAKTGLHDAIVCRTANWGRRKRRNNFPHRGKGTAQSGRRKRDAGEKAALWWRR